MGGMPTGQLPRARSSRQPRGCSRPATAFTRTGTLTIHSLRDPLGEVGCSPDIRRTVEEGKGGSVTTAGRLGIFPEIVRRREILQVSSVIDVGARATHRRTVTVCACLKKRRGCWRVERVLRSFLTTLSEGAVVTRLASFVYRWSCCTACFLDRLLSTLVLNVARTSVWGEGEGLLSRPHAYVLFPKQHAGVLNWTPRVHTIHLLLLFF